MGLTIGSNYLRRSNEWLWKYFEDIKRVSSDLSRSSEGFIEGVDKKGKEKGIIEKFPYVMLLLIVIPYEAAAQNGKNVA